MPGAIGDYLDRLELELRLKRAPRRRLLAEVEDHLRSSADELGVDLPTEEAERRAVERFGSAATVARHFAQTVAASSALRSSYLLGAAFVAYAATVVLFALTAGPEFADFPQGAPSSLALQVMGVAVAVTIVRTVRWRRSPLVPEDRLRLLANGAVVGIGAGACGLALEALVALTRPAGVLPWSDQPLVAATFAVTASVTLVAAVATAAASFRSSLLASLPGSEVGRPGALPTLVDDVGEVLPLARRPLTAVFSRPAVFVGLVTVVAFGVVVLSQTAGHGLGDLASSATPALALACSRRPRSSPATSCSVALSGFAVARRARQIFAALFAATLIAGCVSSSDTKSAPNAQLPSWRKDSCRDVISAPRFARAIARARPLVTRMKAAFGAPGLQVAAAVDGKVVWSRVCGFADARNRRPTTATTLFRVGSVSKAFTAAALARLVQAGKVDLESEVQDYVPSFPRKSGPIRIRHLASHQSGIRHYAGSEALSTVHYDSVLESLSIFADDPLLFRPGSDYSYSSYGFNLLGAALERAAGKDYAGVLREQVLAPLGLSRTQNDRGGLRARGAFYEVREDRSAGPAPRVDLGNRYPSGGLISTAEEVARLGSELGDPGFLTRATQATFFTETRPTNGRPTGHGLGLEVADSPLGRFVRHIGNVVGGTAFLLAHPRSRVAIAMTTNVGWVTVRTPPSLGRSVPDPPQLVVPFIAAARKR